ncbi:5-formyltetrahydrofolate cyclo-ligase [Mycobacteroides immunogenum]|uniref:5-formyltetrahydrofolate cyclo-ligase n=1 Tax=Mycobacteroides immunogenum TaxID=83262 RepID=A0A7V8LLG3_9MYCO|nr:5-formyltetrahydrofolate cyclo-ligase [Mycobacteroides immunogenum]ANO02972.1 5-formyltetrahydrofolate cyclo-ligase [Mycobacteroides immunogenum]KPG05446.1 5-formyltetrahydrofolate cyclo-ligase [Mycobacteroides immunogenum]KPG06312.1 5-formyltetrahydrofolate cyclo-ligase [Mycobacteroides immunogenum]KPG16722.1 5-formyltetrahydrofolate cyclo-ligase [Mycobacteroides immunogenum]
MQARRAISRDEREKQNAALAAHVLTAVSGLSVIAAYLPVGSEPGSVQMLDAVVHGGVRVLLPVARTDQAGTPMALTWAEYRPGELLDAPFGLREPAPPVFGASALAEAELVLVPALAVDRRGNRLGRGAGFYDRSLGIVAPTTALITPLYVGEIRDEIPASPHDVPVTHALTADGLVTLGTGTWRA